jgi:hypothetical protein
MQKVNPMLLSEAYRPRAIRYLDQWRIGPLRMKVYGIAYRGELPATALREAARQVAGQRIAASAVMTSHHGAGFVGIHEGRDGNFIFVDWWADENELHHHVYVSASDEPESLEYLTPSGLVACAWDLHLLCFERDAWVECVLKCHSGPDVERYLETILNTDV